MKTDRIDDSAHTDLVGQAHGAAGSFTLAGAKPSYAPDLELEPTHIEVRLAFDLEQRSATGSVTTRVRALRAGPRSLRLDAVGLLDVLVDSAPGTERRELEWRYDGEHISVTWAQPFEASEERALRVSYRVVDPISGMQFSHPDEAYPERPRFLITDHETERARYWLPCIDYPSVRTTYDFQLTAKSELAIVAGGVLVSEEERGDGTKTAHWHLDHPCPSYLACLAVGEFVRVDDGDVDGRELVYWGVAPATGEQLKRSFGRTGEMMRWMQQRLQREFPFPKYHQIAVPDIGGAMENISLVTWDDMAVLDAELQAERGETIDAINLHEMAHSYFGDSVVIRHFEHAWLKESWAVYMETVWWEESQGRERRDWDLCLNADAYMSEVATSYARPIVTRTYDTSWRLFDRHTYPGGAWRIHMLRELVGDAAFWEATHTYLERFEKRTAETDDFRRCLEEASGKNLVRFFDEWIYAAGHPKLKVSFRHDAERGRAVLTIEQTQVDAKLGIGLFHFPLEVFWTDEAGEHVERVAVSEARHEVVFEASSKPRTVELDPESRVLFALDFDPGEDLLRAALERPSLKTRVWAVRTLIARGRQSAFESVEAALGPDSFFGLRTVAAEELAKTRTAAGAACLGRLVAREQDARALSAVMAAAGGLRDEHLRSALLERLDAGKLPPRAQGMALTSLGAQRHEQDIERLSTACEARSIHELVRAGALRGLGELGGRVALELLLERSEYGRELELARPAAIEGLAKAAARLEHHDRLRARDALCDLLRDPRSKIRMQAARSLGALGMPSASAALDALRKVQPAQDGPAIERIIKKLAAGAAGEELVSLRTELERWQKECRDLAERLDSLEAAQRSEA